MSDLKDLTWNPFKVTWVNSVGISLWVENECPYQNDLMLVIWPNPIKMNGIDEKWMNRGRISEMKWNEWFEGFDLEQPYEKVPMRWMKVSLWKWLGWTLWESPYQNEWNRWEMNEMKWIEVKWVNGWKWLGTTLWVSPYESVEGVPIKVTWVKVKINVPIKMNGIDEKWMKWSE